MSGRIKFLLAAIVVAISGCGGSDVVGPKVDPSPQLSVAPVPQSLSLQVGGSVQLGCMIKKGNGEQPCPETGVNWSSSNPLVVTVTNGAVTAVGAGTATVTVTYNGVNGTATVTVTAPPVTLQSIAIVGDSTQERAGSYQYGCLATYSNGDQKILDTCTWSYPNPDYVTGEVDSTGLVKLWSLGVLRVTASKDGFQSTVAVRLTGTPWSKAMKIYSISPQAKEMLKGWINPHMGVQNPDFSVPVMLWIGPGVSVQGVIDGVAFWTEDTYGLVQFVQVSDSTNAVAKVSFDPSLYSDVCGVGSPSGVRINPNPPGCDNKYVLAHEFGHWLGLPHMPSSTDIMGYPGFEWKSDPVRREALNLKLRLPNGTILVEG